MRELVPFVQFKKREKHPWRSDTFSKVADFNLWYLYFCIVANTKKYLLYQGLSGVLDGNADRIVLCNFNIVLGGYSLFKKSLKGKSKELLVIKVILVPN